MYKPHFHTKKDLLNWHLANPGYRPQMQPPAVTSTQSGTPTPMDVSTTSTSTKRKSNISQVHHPCLRCSRFEQGTYWRPCFRDCLNSRSVFKVNSNADTEPIDLTCNSMSNGEDPSDGEGSKESSESSQESTTPSGDEELPKSVVATALKYDPWRDHYHTHCLFCGRFMCEIQHVTSE